MTHTEQPNGAAIAALRIALGLTQAQAAELVYLSRSDRWSEYERDITKIDPARWELFLIKTGQHPNYSKTTCNA